MCQGVRKYQRQDQSKFKALQRVRNELRVKNKMKETMVAETHTKLGRVQAALLQFETNCDIMDSFINQCKLKNNIRQNSVQNALEIGSKLEMAYNAYNVEIENDCTDKDRKQAVAKRNEYIAKLQNDYNQS